LLPEWRDRLRSFAINIFLEVQAPACRADENEDGSVSVGELQRFVTAFLGLLDPCS